MNRRRAAVGGALALSLAVTGTALGSPASAAPPRTLRITDAKVTDNAGYRSVLEIGDSFRIVLNKPVMAYAPDLAVRVRDRNGDAVYLSDNGSEISYTIEDLVVRRKGRTRTYPDRVLSVTIRDAYDYLPRLDLPLRITGVDGLYNKGDYDEAVPVDLARSRDTVVNREVRHRHRR
jgi:hypothetical protein